MLKRIFKPLLATLFLWNVALAQDEEVKTSKEFKINISEPFNSLNDSKLNYNKGYYSNNGNTISLKKDGQKIYIQKFNAITGNQESVKMYDDFPSKYYIIGTVELKTKLYLVYFEKLKGDPIRILAREVSYEKGIFVSEAKEIYIVLDKIGSNSSWNENQLKNYDHNVFINFQYPTISEKFHTPIFEDLSLFVSNDKSFFLLQYKHYPLYKNNSINQDKYGVVVFNENIEKTVEKTVEIPYKEIQMNHVSTIIDNHGTVHFLLEYFFDSYKNKYLMNGMQNFSFQLMTIDNEGIRLFKTEINLNNKYINQIKFFENTNGELILAGFYGNKFNTTNGAYSIQLSKQGELINQHYYEIPNDFIKLYTSEPGQNNLFKKQLAEQELNLTKIKLRQINYLNDGSSLIVGEKNYFTEETSYSNGADLNKDNYSSRSFYYEEIIIIKISKNKELQWMKKIPKRQVGSIGRGSMSYKYLFVNEKHYFLYLDNIKNLELPENKSPISYIDKDKGVLFAYQIEDTSGEVQKLTLFDMNNVEGMKLKDFGVEKSIQIEEHVIFVELKKSSKEDVMLKIEIND